MFTWMIKKIVGFATGGVLDKIFDTIDTKVDNETERQAIKAEVTKTYVQAQANVLTEKTWLLQFLYAVPLGIWFSSIIVYSIFWCKDCAYPQSWTIAALPEPLDEWSGAIITAVFLVEGAKFYSRRKG